MLWEDVKAAEEKPPVRHPNRDLPESHTARLGTIALLALTIVMLIVVAIGGWDTLVGAKGLHLTFIVVYGIFIAYVVRWNRGVLPVVAAVAVMLGAFALVAGPDWFARDKTGYTDPTLPESILGIVTLALIPVQMLLVVVSMWGFSQKWNVEIEIKPGDPGGPPLTSQQAPPSAPPTAAPAS
ncbi:MAG: hypothetical protein WAP35_08720 [Solirubrobacterales bacterium]